MGNQMKIVLLRNNVFQRERCFCCGEVFDSNCVIAAILEEELNEAKSHHLIRHHHNTKTAGYVCEGCLEAGRDGVKQKMLERASELYSYACFVRQKANEDIELPTIETYQEQIKKEENQLKKEWNGGK